MINIKTTLEYNVDVATHVDKSDTAMIFLHGAGERGSDPTKILFWIQRVMPREIGLSYIVPMCPAESRWNPVIVSSLIKQYNKDFKNIVLAGHSMGARGVWDTLFFNPNINVYSSVPISGVGCYLVSPLIRHHRICILHGEADNVVPVIESDRMYDSLLEETQSSSIIYYRIPGAGHNIAHVLANQKVLRFALPPSIVIQ